MTGAIQNDQVTLTMGKMEFSMLLVHVMVGNANIQTESDVEVSAEQKRRSQRLADELLKLERGG